MFTKKDRKIKELQGLVQARTKALKEAESKIKRLEEVQRGLKRQIEDEHLENYKHHVTLLAIRNLVSNFDYKQSNSINVIRKINNELDNLHID